MRSKFELYLFTRHVELKFVDFVFAGFIVGTVVHVSVLPHCNISRLHAVSANPIGKDKGPARGNWWQLVTKVSEKNRLVAKTWRYHVATGDDKGSREKSRGKHVTILFA